MKINDAGKKASKLTSLLILLIASLTCATIALALTSFGSARAPYTTVPVEVKTPQVYVLTDRDYYHSLINDLRRANKSIYVAMYSMVYDPSDAFDWANDLIRELVNAKNRGVDVKVVIEFRTYHGYMNDNMEAYNYLSSSGVHVKLDQEADTDHLKLVVIDGEIVYVGSHNWSESALYYNREASVRIVSEEVAKRFLDYLKNNYGL
ncbi:MAG: phospholipase D-like domain-containing protein [Candidatus Verstraetearchaeota archaeon]|jgi:phosphatidylserine/phosphatidylglycerophosphate/cardiolipin synthase-like enzyme|nr:phospholipase D-like domain-containing protein [Candidatus Verstraetearchaeota archaeon]